jgi:hypothetical protein
MAVSLLQHGQIHYVRLTLQGKHVLRSHIKISVPMPAIGVQEQSKMQPVPTLHDRSLLRRTVHNFSVGRSITHNKQ